MNCDYTERYVQIKKNRNDSILYRTQRELRRSASEF